jgi:hypothetical protein
LNPDDLGYDPASLVGPLDMNRVLASQRAFQDRGMPIVFDPAYIRHLSAYHGGVPKKRCFKTREGYDHVIERFLHFADKKGSPDKLGPYNVDACWGMMIDRINDYLIPFATLFAGDILCFDYENVDSETGVRPRVVVWFHEESEEDAPVTQLVADNFDEFLSVLHECEDEPASGPL